MKILFSLVLALLLVVGMGGIVSAQEEEIELFGTTLELQGGMVYLPSFDSITPAGEVQLLCGYNCTVTAGLAATKLSGDDKPDVLAGVSFGVDFAKLVSVIPGVEFALPFDASVSGTLMTDMTSIKHIRGYWGVIGKLTLYTR